MYNERHKILPPLPSTTAYININGIWAQTTSGEPFLLADDDTNRRILIFTTPKNLAHFATADTIYGDRSLAGSSGSTAALRTNLSMSLFSL
jgi:hypothetical protein